MVAVRKELAGSDSFGNTWAEDGAVIDVPWEQAHDLVRIPDAGISIVPGHVFDEPDDDADEPDNPRPRRRRRT